MAQDPTHGVNWHELLNLVGPVVGEVASHGSRGSFLEGFMRAQERNQIKQKQDAEAAQQKQIAAAQYLMQIGEHAGTITDPTDWENFVSLAEHAGSQAGYVQPNELRQSIKFNAGKAATARNKALEADLDVYAKRYGEEGLQKIAETPATFTPATGGPPVKFADAIKATGRYAQDPTTGATIPPPQKAGGTMDERAALLKTQIRAAKAAGDTAKAATLQAEYDDLVSAAGDMSGAKRAPVDPQIETLRALAIEAAKNGPRGRFNVQPITNPDGTTGLVRVNMDTGEATRVDLKGAGSGRASDTERLSSAYMTRAQAADGTATSFEQDLAKLGAQFDVKLPNLLKSEPGQRYRQAKDEFINAALRRESGAAIQPSEYERYDKIYFVQPGDTPATIKQKQTARARVVAGFKVTAGNLGGSDQPTAPTTAPTKIGRFDVVVQ